MNRRRANVRVREVAKELAEAGYPFGDERRQSVGQILRALVTNLKARGYSIATGLPAVAEDSGLEIDALGGAPGVRSARFGGAALTYPERFILIEEALREKPKDRTARFVCALALADGKRTMFEARGVVEGTIAPEPRGEGGFGYDPIFFYPPFGCTFAEAGERKLIVSHRAQAFAQLRDFLRRKIRS